MDVVIRLFFCIIEFRCSQKLLRRHSQVVLKQSIQIASVNAHIISHVRYFNGVTIIALNKGNRLLYILIPPGPGAISGWDSAAVVWRNI